METNNNSNNGYERLQQVMEWAGMTTHAFAMYIGMRRSENIFRIIRNKESLSIKLSNTITTAFPAINSDWLMLGEGEMFNRVIPDHTHIPFYNTLNDDPTSYISFPDMYNIDLALAVKDQYMEPIINKGAAVLLEKQTPYNIIYGRIYYIETLNFKGIRTIQKSDISEDELLLSPTNNIEHNTISTLRLEITTLYLVRFVLNNLC